eukprot:TRINITY_DN6013_c0_g1_i2.p1 TRINITY_DN6013_c0_g1~~TRINITY_DN6013_c0_g1_i2.p1  ORF type:complete len:347 (-),score=36.14 TRINITY_DN6013_c0_g1_i2:73-1113(-)
MWRVILKKCTVGQGQRACIALRDATLLSSQMLRQQTHQNSQSMPSMLLGQLQQTQKLKIKSQHITQINQYKIKIEPIQTSRDKLLFSMLNLKDNLGQVIISGMETINRAVINVKGEEHNLLVEGNGLKEVMCTEGVDGTKTTSNHVLEVEKVLGIEAARASIIYEMKYTLSQHGLNIDSRHLSLLGDVMTYKGRILGITRFGISSMRDSTLLLASFEKTIDHLFDSAALCRKDRISGVSECIIMGMPVPLGTAPIKLFMAPPKRPSLHRRPLLFDHIETELKEEDIIIQSLSSYYQQKKKKKKKKKKKPPLYPLFFYTIDQHQKTTIKKKTRPAQQKKNTTNKRTT